MTLGRIPVFFMLYAPETGEAMDNADYEAWRESRLQGAFPTAPDLLPLTEKNISLVG